jgi:hypothetical protein
MDIWHEWREVLWKNMRVVGVVLSLLARCCHGRIDGGLRDGVLIRGACPKERWDGNREDYSDNQEHYEHLHECETMFACLSWVSAVRIAVGPVALGGEPNVSSPTQMTHCSQGKAKPHASAAFAIVCSKYVHENLTGLIASPALPLW